MATSSDVIMPEFYRNFVKYFSHQYCVLVKILSHLHHVNGNYERLYYYWDMKESCRKVNFDGTYFRAKSLDSGNRLLLAGGLWKSARPLFNLSNVIMWNISMVPQKMTKWQAVKDRSFFMKHPVFSFEDRVVYCDILIFTPTPIITIGNYP